MKRLGTLGLILSLLLPPTAIADGNEEAIYLYRSQVMEASAGHLKALKHYAEGGLTIEGHVTAHVDALLTLNGLYQGLFPAGNQHPDSEAKPAIWGDPRGFQGAIQHNRRQITALKQVDRTDLKGLKRAVNEVRMSCGGCHYYFKER